MKRLTALLIMLVYLPAIAGVSFNTHYCGGKSQSTKIFSFSKESCCGDDPAEDECCSDHLTFVKLEKDQLGQDSRSGIKQSFHCSFLPHAYSSTIIFGLASVSTIQVPVYSPPPLTKKLPILYCTFLI